MYRVALVTPGYFVRGGTRTMTQFLEKVLSQSGIFESTIISLCGRNGKSRVAGIRNTGRPKD